MGSSYQGLRRSGTREDISIHRPRAGRVAARAHPGGRFHLLAEEQRAHVKPLQRARSTPGVLRHHMRNMHDKNMQCNIIVGVSIVAQPDFFPGILIPSPQ